MSWIRKHWEPDWIVRAEGILKGLVSSFVFYVHPDSLIIFTAG
jgi:hypothetical protein